ncbi:MAG: transcription factor [Methanofollis liminatans]|jgi:transcription initiation factor TFIIE subunit alpha|uniref:Transcription factor E n=1 Tax=Methanofollis liminatans DSM 4140 TaxID=28892 RepID=J1ARC5_9EURY|nr:transcription factor [Methanofollis liminatans]EJG07543.1 Transcription factor E [Methanofollis liminatans DSM 4140]MDD3111049.1 transcription factor [Methanofollis liminatans]
MVGKDEMLADPAIRAYLLRLIGNEGINLMERFPPDGEFSDEELAEKTGINLNSVRHTLYTLYERRLAEYRRIKDPDTGWLTYLWMLRTDQVYPVLKEELEHVLELLVKREKYEEENDFFICDECGIFTFNDVFATDFACPQCGEPLKHFDNEMLLGALKRRIEAIRKSTGHV